MLTQIMPIGSCPIMEVIQSTLLHPLLTLPLTASSPLSTHPHHKIAQWESACTKTKRSAVQASSTASCYRGELFTYI